MIKYLWNNIISLDSIAIEQEKVIESSLNATDKNCILIVAKDLAIEFKDRNLQEWIGIVTKLREEL